MLRAAGRIDRPPPIRQPGGGVRVSDPNPVAENTMFIPAVLYTDATHQPDSNGVATSPVIG